MIGYHVQSGIPGWLDPIKAQQSGTWNKAVNDLSICRELKKANPGAKVVFRKEYNRYQNVPPDYEGKKEKARKFFNTFIDGTFWEQEFYKYIDGIEEFNEYLANSQGEEERSHWIEWCRAVNDVWTTEYRTDSRLAHIRLVSCNTAIGNDIDWRFAEIVQAHDGILAYHNYTEVHYKEVTDGDWRWLSGRWTVMDDAYRAKGIRVKWLMTEGGPFAGVTEGWRHPYVYSGDLPAHINGQIKYQIDRCSAWNNAHDNRMLGQVLFTVGNTGSWDKYEYNASEMLQVSKFVKSYAPQPVPPPIPPPPTDETWEREAWAISVQEQIDRGIPLNPNAALQNRILADRLVPVHRERTHEGKTFQAAESLSGSPQRRVYVWEPGLPIWWFNEP
jgi:hypothetical protein